MKLRREVRWLRPIAVIVAVALACGAYILNKQRLESPFADRYPLVMEFDAVDAVTPGLGSPITVAGVSVGQIDGKWLENGRGILRASVDPAELPRVYADATAALIPNTPLKDMQIRLHPGDPGAGRIEEGDRIPIRSTTSPIDADELLRALDADTRAWMQTLLAESGRGLEDRSLDLRSVLASLGPTAAQMRRITGLLASRREAIAELVTDLRAISDATARSDDELRQVVDAGTATLEAVAAGEAPLRRSLELLPPTLAGARSTLANVRPLAASLDRALTAVDPSLRSLETTLRESPGALQGLVPLPLDEFERFVDAVGPLGSSVRPATRDLGTAGPLLERSFGVLGRAVNLIAYEPPGDARGYMFHLAWFLHNANSTVSTGDAHGSVFRGYALFSCSSESPPSALGEPIREIAGIASACPDGEDGP